MKHLAFIFVFIFSLWIHAEAEGQKISQRDFLMAIERGEIEDVKIVKAGIESGGIDLKMDIQRTSAAILKEEVHSNPIHAGEAAKEMAYLSSHVFSRWTPLYRAANLFLIQSEQLRRNSGPRWDIFNLLLKDAKTNKNVSDSRGISLVHHVSSFPIGNGVLRLLLKQEVDIHTIENRYGDTPLHAAVESGAFENVVYLIKAGAKPGVRNFAAGMAPLHLAVIYSGEFTNKSHDRLHIVSKLIELKVDVNVIDRGGITPLDYAVFFDVPAEVIKLLVKAGANRSDVSLEEIERFWIQTGRGEGSKGVNPLPRIARSRCFS